ncbi:MAG: hypothetical protein LBO21_01450 [Synergistaceae bacterium]|nr:hypothetical protein [Synergistaceae bacterium]
MAKTTKDDSGTPLSDDIMVGSQVQDKSEAHVTPGETPRTSREPLIYCGPSLPRAKIISGSLYRGGLPKNIEALIGKIPEIGRLTVPVSKLAETQRKISEQGTEENRLYQAISSRRGEIENAV